jgi:hypothetical protein
VHKSEDENGYEDKDEDEDEDEDDNGEDIDEDNDGDDGIDPRNKIDIGRHPIEFRIYEVWAQKDRGSVKYWIYSADYIMEDGDSKPDCNEEATRAEAIAHVVEANDYEDPEEWQENRIELEWLSKGADGERNVDFPQEDDILEYWDENEWMIERDESYVGS